MPSTSLCCSTKGKHNILIWYWPPRCVGSNAKSRATTQESHSATLLPGCSFIVFGNPPAGRQQIVQIGKLSKTCFQLFLCLVKSPTLLLVVKNGSSFSWGPLPSSFLCFDFLVFLSLLEKRTGRLSIIKANYFSQNMFAGITPLHWGQIHPGPRAVIATICFVLCL